MPVLVVIGADFSLRERIGAVSLSFTLRFQDEAPRERRLGEAAFVQFPEGASIITRAPRRYPVIGYGPVACMADAFALGVADYLVEPWCIEEFQLRAERTLGTGNLAVNGTALSLSGLVLGGPNGEVVLPFEQASLLRQLIIAEGAGLSRSVLRRYLWPSLGEGSRAVDVAASRLRRQLIRVSGKDPCVQLRSVRGIGYSLVVLNPLCGSCG